MFPEGWITPDWPSPANVRAVCTSRSGGVSHGAYASLNLGDHVADDADDVMANRRLFAEALLAHPVFLKQVHGRHVQALGHDTPHGMEADGCVTTQRGVACTIMVADCLPILFSTRDGAPVAAVAAAHAGWRGLLGEGGRGVIETTCEALRETSGAKAHDLIAWLGPCIGPDAFEVGAEVREAFAASGSESLSCFKPHRADKWLADLPALARQRLRGCGISEIYGNDASTAWCTASNPSRFFSHRRDRISGRLAASVWLA